MVLHKNGRRSYQSELRLYDFYDPKNIRTTPGLCQKPMPCRQILSLAIFFLLHSQRHRTRAYIAPGSVGARGQVRLIPPNTEYQNDNLTSGTFLIHR